MQIRRYVASDIKEAMAKIKSEMGNDAVILHTRYFKEGGILGLFRKNYVEVTAASDNNNTVNFPLISFPAHAKLTVTGKHNNRPAYAGPITAEPPVSKELAGMKTIMAEMSEMLGNKNSMSKLPKIGQHLYSRLKSQEVEDKIAARIVKKTLQQLSLNTEVNGEQLNSLLFATLLKPLKKGKPIAFSNSRQKRPKIYAMVGPTGVGKTTTLAKLAAMFAVIEQRKVSCVTVDTYRIAASEQLKTIGEIMNVPVHVVYSLNQLRECLKDAAESEMVFLDTAGRSHKNSGQLDELKRFLEIAQPDEVFLVLSSTSKYQDLREIIAAYEEMNITKLIITKLDETSYFGPLYNIACRTKYPLAYFTTGQTIPDDIEAADPVKLVQLLTKEH